MAIAYDSSSNGTANPGTSVTFSHTCSGSDRLLLVGVLTNDTTDKITGVTYNGVAMTRLSAQQASSTNFYGFIYYLVAPATGANNVVISRSDSGLVGGMAASYTGVSQTGFPDSQAKGTDATGPYDMTTTVVAADSWLFANTRSNDTDGVISLSSGVKRQSVFAGNLCIIDSNGALGAGSRTITVTVSPGNEVYWLMCSFAPASSAVNVTVTPSALVLTSSLPTPTVSAVRNVSVAPDVLTLTTSLPTPSVAISAQVSPSVLTLTTSLPTPAVSAGGNVTVTPATLTLTSTVQEPTVSVEVSVTVTPAVLAITTSTPEPSVSLGTGVSVAVSPLSLSASLPTPTVTAEKDVTVTVSPLTLSISLLEPSKIGATWQRIGRYGSSDDWSRVARTDVA